jgi:CcmD family protein
MYIIKTNAQSNSNISNGKMDAVIYVFAAILIGVFIYLFTLDKKLTKLENQIKDEQ